MSRAALVTLLALSFVVANENPRRRGERRPAPAHVRASGCAPGRSCALGISRSIPDSFSWGEVPVDGGDRNVSYLTPVLNQHIPQYCGACWAFATLSSLADRIKIERKGRGADIILSPQHVLNCVEKEDVGSCHGGSESAVYAWLLQNKIALAYTSVNPYLACSSDSDEGICPSIRDYTTCEPQNIARNCDTFIGKDGGGKCIGLNPYPNVTIAGYGEITGADAIRKEVHSRGPVACVIDAAPLDDYAGGIIPAPALTYKVHVDHVVSIVGFGVEGGVPYWVARNSWGEAWGEMGFFRIESDMDAYGIEASCTWAVIDRFTDEPLGCGEDGSNCEGAGDRDSASGDPDDSPGQHESLQLRTRRGELVGAHDDLAALEPFEEP